jgi:hypothetical protein
VIAVSETVEVLLILLLCLVSLEALGGLLWMMGRRRGIKRIEQTGTAAGARRV